MTTVAGRLIKEALSHLLVVQEVTATPSLSAERVKAIDLLTIREHTHIAVMKLLTADAILSEPAPRSAGQEEAEP